MNFKETKFAYRHKPTGKWVHIHYHFDEDLWEDDKYPYVHEMELVDDFLNASIEENCKIKHSLKDSTLNGEKYAALNFHEFELVEIEIESAGFLICPSCGGEGEISYFCGHESSINCPMCGGEGIIKSLKKQKHRKTCTICSGRGGLGCCNSKGFVEWESYTLAKL